ncbi:CpaF family protein [Jatrophihabitans lederbergiae]|uniref:ATPase, T2SS/T4P/T4SS family n=1 Tax=Jatrophihabitans lederbergiae TaxID=3075547 RepID=A0ABU2JF33_9ACTN|nr:ATPase, T2SS/T4P/T4SS family [Jatrophihabitans sp. DSM 44399]MDT0263612.1 ATPase, T2SS/T4P/T4SS family [Jatrophihabitans sp. DSM 44399]
MTATTSTTAGAERLRARLRTELPARLAAHTDTAASAPDQRRELARRLAIEIARAHTEAELMANRPLLDNATEQRIVTEVLDETFGMAGLQPLLDDESIENINVNGCDRVFVRYADGSRAQLPPIAPSDAEVEQLVRTLAARAGSEERRFDRGSPAVNLQLPDGSRLFAVSAVTAGGRPAIAIRRHRYRTVTLPDLRRLGTIDQRLTGFLTALVRARKNLLITGGTGIGKTTLLRALASAIEPSERLVTIEDAFELGLDTDPAHHPDVVALQAREANIEGEGAISQAELVRWALRMSPDRVIVGEIRGPEVVPMCNAMSQGNDGSMATLHASSSRIAFTRLAAYAAQGPERLPLEATNLLIASAVHFVLHLASTPDGTRVVSSIREVIDADDRQIVSNEIYQPGPERRATPAAPPRSETADELIAAGLHPGILNTTVTGRRPR